jgi:hypothetical protein
VSGGGVSPAAGTGAGAAGRIDVGAGAASAASASAVGGTAGGTPSASAVDVGAGAGVVGGGASVETAVGSSTNLAGGGANVETLGASSEITGSADGAFTGEAGEAAINQTIGADGSAVISGGAGGVAEQRASGDLDVRSQAEQATHAQDLEAKVSVQGGTDAAIAGSGVEDPRDQVQAKVDAVDSARSDAQSTMQDPRGAATARGEDAVNAEVESRAPINPGEARANVEAASSAVHDPQGAVQGRVDVRVDEQEREAQASIGVEGLGTQTPPSPKK